MTTRPLGPRRPGAESPLYDELMQESGMTWSTDPPREPPKDWARTSDPLLADQYPSEEQHSHGGRYPLTSEFHASLRRIGDRRGLIASPNHSSRGGAKVRLLIVHTAEGSKTVESLGAYFASAANEVSSHAGIDDQRIETYVPYEQAAWTARSANAIADQVELCGFAAWTRDQWINQHPNMLTLTARWLRERAVARGIPLVKLSPADVAAGHSGVCGHADWTNGMHDGTHTDPGTGFPWDQVIAMAAAGGGPFPPQPVPVHNILGAAEQQLYARRELPWLGGLSNIAAGGPVTPEEYDLFMYAQRINVTTWQSQLQLKRIETKLDAIMAKLDMITP